MNPRRRGRPALPPGQRTVTMSISIARDIARQFMAMAWARGLSKGALLALLMKEATK
jgi:hypothetical protein